MKASHGSHSTWRHANEHDSQAVGRYGEPQGPNMPKVANCFAVLPQSDQVRERISTDETLQPLGYSENTPRNLILQRRSLARQAIARHATSSKRP
jgi:hypothetical protein